jgi:hypothetical protein
MYQLIDMFQLVQLQRPLNNKPLICSSKGLRAYCDCHGVSSRKPQCSVPNVSCCTAYFDELPASALHNRFEKIKFQGMKVSAYLLRQI